jgi:hypothetical protein
MKLIGILLVLNSIALTAWWITTHNSNKAAAITVCLIAVFAGLGLILQDRITELTVKGVGTIRSATEQVQIDAKTVSDLKARVENQSATVDLVAKEASKAKELSAEVAEKNRRAEDKLNTLDEAITKAKYSLLSLDTATEYAMTVLAAQNDDRSAFDTLRKWAEDKNNPFMAKAKKLGAQYSKAIINLFPSAVSKSLGWRASIHLSFRCRNYLSSIVEHLLSLNLPY